MAEFLARLEWMKNKGKTDPEVIDDWKTINIRISSELKNNMMTITLPNDFSDFSKAASTPRKYNNSIGRLQFQVEDKFKLYAKYDRDNSGLDLSENSNDLIFFGDFRELDNNVGDKTTLTLKCTDRTYNLLNRIG